MHSTDASSDDDASSPADGPPPPQPAPAAGRRPRPGRPPGPYSCFAVQAVSRRAAACLVAPGPGDEARRHETDALLRFLRPGLGEQVHSTVVSAVLRPSEDDPTLEALVEQYLGEVPRACTSATAEAQLLKLERRAIPAEVRSMAGVVHYGGRAWLTSFLSHVNTEIAAGRIMPLAIFVHLAGDETTMRVRGHQWQRQHTTAEGATTVFPAEALQDEQRRGIPETGHVCASIAFLCPFADPNRNLQTSSWPTLV